MTTTLLSVNGTEVVTTLAGMSIEQLVEQHNDMIPTAVDFGLTAEPVTSFGSTAEGAAACERLHTQIMSARERAAAPKKVRRATAKKTAAKTAEERATAAEPAVVTALSAKTTPTKEKIVAKKAKKSKAKKVAKKVARAGNGGARAVNAKYPLDAKINWTAEGNPARKDTIFYERVEKVRKAKTIDSMLKAGGSQADARECAKRGWCKPSGGTRV